MLSSVVKRLIRFEVIFKGIETMEAIEPAVRFENHLTLRVMEVIFPNGFKIDNSTALQELKTAWTANLRMWHSPYTCLFDVRNLQISAEMKPEFDKAIKFFSGFFMRKIIGFANGESPQEGLWPFQVFANYQDAANETGLGREGGLKRDLSELRSRIQIDNDFNAHVMDISLLAETNFETKEDVVILQSKLRNILKQWHSPYSVLFNCVNVTFSPEAKNAFAQVERFLKNFFCKEIIGYAPKGEKGTYPFKMLRSRHLAAAELENNGLQSGAVANCSTRKPL